MAEAEGRGLRRRAEEDVRTLLLHRLPQEPREPRFQLRQRAPRPASLATKSSSNFLKWWWAVCELLSPTSAATSRTLGGGSPARRAR